MAFINLPKKKDKRVKTLRNKEYQEIYQDPRWKSLRGYKFRHTPICENCESKGVTASAKEVHHIVKFSEGRNRKEVELLAFSRINLMSLCVKCHKEKHERYKTDHELKDLILNKMDG